jgi:small subunit ribosomal protein S1
MAKAKITMDELLASEQNTQKIVVNELVSGKVFSVKKSEILVDLGALGTGFIPRREAVFLRDTKIGDDISASVIDPEMGDGTILLSLRKASKDRGWDAVYEYKKNEQTVEVLAYDANRGGLLADIDGVRGFLPVSQLSGEHYPRVNGGSNGDEKTEILKKLNELVGKPIRVKVLDVDKRANKLIFSEKEALRDAAKEKMSQIKVGDKMKATVTGIVDFGVFVNIDGVEGLIHISELSWERTDTVGDKIKLGDTVDVKVVSVENDRLSLSIKQLGGDPWASEVEKLKIGDEIKGTVTKITPFGAFVQISPLVEALAHATDEDGKKSDPEKVFKLNAAQNFVITDIDLAGRKITLATAKSAKVEKAAKKPTAKKTATKK